VGNVKYLKPPAVGLLEQWRKEQGWTVARLAEAIGRGVDIVHAWRHCRARPTLPDILALERVTGIGAELWVDEEEQRRLSGVVSD
jgi:ribosome-binding protein aMBF1 (putative translation factor)